MNVAIHLDRPTAYEPAAATDDRRLPAKYANHRFQYVHYTNGWSFSEEHGFIPELSEIVAQPGVNGVDIHGNVNRAVAGSFQKGGTMINPADGRLGKHRNHIGSYECKNGRKHWCWIGTKYDILPGGSVSPRDTSAGFVEFRLHLRDSGLISPMEEAVFNKLLEIETRRYDRAVKGASKNPLLVEVAKQQGDRRNKMQRAWNEMQANGEPVGDAGAPIPDDPGFVIPTEPGKVRVGKPKGDA